VALDVETAGEARATVSKLGETASFYKIGLELYASAGPEFVRELKKQGNRVFLDLKMYDIPETVKRAVAQVARLDADFLTIHAMKPVMAAAALGRGESPLKLLAVTVLTSFDDRDLEQMGYRLNVRELVELRVKQALETGMNGIVCSAMEVSRVREIAGPDAILVTPGVRSAGADPGDQKRVTTPGEAIRNGADYVVMGRQITRAADPRKEMLSVLEEIAALR